MHDEYEALSVYQWWKAIQGQEKIPEIVNCMKTNEMPNVCSVVFERMCSGNCGHCLYACSQKSSKPLSLKYDLENSLLNILQQLPEEQSNLFGLPPVFNHIGREFNPSEIPIIQKCKTMRPDILTSLFNKGDYVKFIKDILNANVLFDWLDISVDGTESHHNKQRRSTDAFKTAISGIRNARKIITPNGLVNTLFTITKLNYHCIEETASMLLEKELVDNVVFFPLTPNRRGIECLETSQKEFEIAWKQLRKIFARYNSTDKEKVSLHFFRHKDMEKVFKIIGKRRFQEAFFSFSSGTNNGIQGMGVGKIKLKLDDLTLFYFPTSICVTEGYLIDPDAAIRTPFSQQSDLFDLRYNPWLENYTFQQLDSNTNLRRLYTKMVKKWWQNFGHHYLTQETEAFN